MQIYQLYLFDDLDGRVVETQVMSKKILKSVYLLMAITSICACQSTKPRKWTSDDLLLSNQLSFEAIVFPDKISSSQSAEDIDFLIFALSTAYSGRQYAPEESFSRAIAALKSIAPKSTVSEFHDQIDESLFLIPDNHLMAFYKGRVSRKRRQQQKISQVGSNNISNPQKIWETRIDRVGNKKVLYISIVRFPDEQSEVWKGFIPSIASKAKSAHSIVIDLRGNSGGDDAKGMELAQVLYGRAIEHPIKRQYRTQTPEALALLANRLNIEIINLKYDHQDVPDYLVDEFNRSQHRYNMAIKGEMPPEFIRTDKGLGRRTDTTINYKKPIYILMDRSCGSSCEFTIAAFERHHHVKRVGENTEGAFHFSNTGLAVLPNSKIKVMIPTQYSEYGDRRFIERIGFSPDVKVPPGEDAYTVTKKMIGGQIKAPSEQR